MLQNKMSKILLFSIITLLLSGLLYAQSSSSLTERFLTNANEEYSKGNYESAYKTVNAAIKLNEKDGIPENVFFLAKTIYRKYLEEIVKNKDFSAYEDVAANLQKYPVIGDDAQIQKNLKLLLEMKTDLKDAARDARNREMMESLSKNSQEGNEKMMNSIADKMNTAIEEVGKKTAEAVNKSTETTANAVKEISERNNKTMWLVVIIGGIIFIIVLLLILVGIRISSRATQMQTAQLDSTLKMIAGMQQTNNQLLLGGITDLNGMGLKSAGSSRWGVDALPAPEMSDEEKAELKQLVIDCEKLGSEVDAATKRKNKSKNVSELVYKLAMQLGLNQNSSMIYFCAGMVYDAGLLALPQELLEAENLAEDERQQLREHVKMYEQYLGFVPKKYWKIFEEAAKYHSENMDGSGYYGLKGEDIPQIARLIHVAESYVSLISRRNYRQIHDKESAIKELEANPGLYDNDVVKVLDAIV